MARSAPENDPTEDNVDVGLRRAHAAGLPGVVETLELSHAQTGVRRTTRTLLRVDQPSGVDFRVVPCDTARGCAAAYFPETNGLVALDSVARVSSTPVSRSIVVRLEHRTEM